MPHRRAKNAQPLTTDQGRDMRVREVMADVAFRLLGVCAGLPPDEFAVLVRRIAEVTVKYEALAELRAARIPTPPEPRDPRDPRALPSDPPGGNRGPTA